ncbi:MAG: hypothetical protein MI919_02425 [Holophagales bacterium]|nr:hypothetical protein [Holophagales bacterium]
MARHSPDTSTIAPDTSSIGPQWPPRPSSHRRIKGIDNRRVIRTGGQLQELLASLEELVPGLDRSADRLSVRALVEERLLGEHREVLAPWAEAVIPLEDCGDALEGLVFLYLGRNLPSRSSHGGDLERSLEHVRLAEKRRPKRASEMIERVRDGGYGLRLLDRAERLGDPQLRRAMAVLYERFGWNAEDTRQILANPDSLIAVATVPALGSAPAPRTAGVGQARVVSAGIAELGRVRFGDGAELCFAELTEAATLAEHQGHGLYSGIISLLMAELAARSRRGEVLGGTLDLCFGECSGLDFGVLIAARHMGRRSSLRALEKRGLPFRGFLPQHVPIGGARRSTPYNDLFPTYVSRERIYRFAEGELLEP